MNAVDLSPALRLLMLAAGLALLPLSWWWLRQRNADWRARLAALCALTLFLTFDLIIFGAFTRLSDSGLGCPDWPGCYGHASPLGASAHIDAAQQALPSGPVTLSKAWVEMIHRYLAMTVGALIVVMTVAGWARRRALPFSPWWPTATLAWVVVQGLFGKYTVTLKLYPAVVTLHLLGGMVLLALLTVQHARFRDRPLPMPRALKGASIAVLALLAVQLALGGWVSSNYAVLACSGFPQCNDSWWPQMNFAAGFTPLRELGRSAEGAYLPVDALVAIHYVHRAFAAVVLAALAWLAWRLWQLVAARPLARWLAALAALQLASGLSNVVLGWPLAAALLHTAGAAALVMVLCTLWARAAVSPRAAASCAGADGSAPASLKSRCMAQTLATPAPTASRWSQFYALTKPRVVQLIVFCALIGMLLAEPGLPDLWLAAAATVGIWLVAAAAAAFNCLVEQHIDAKMARTAWRPTAKGELTNAQTLSFSALLCLAGSVVLYVWVNPLTMWLTFATFIGYAVIYTVVLKPLTPQNIVIGGASGAMPPVLGWAAMRNDVGPEALMLCLIIFLWTPPHFWALALYRAEDYRKSGLPMLPITHGSEFTRLQVLLYTLVLFAATLLPFTYRMSGWFYLVAALVLGGVFIAYAVRLWRHYSDALARRTFRYSILYLSLLFSAMLIDHYLMPWLS